MTDKRLAARNINANAVKRRDFLAQQRAVFIRVLPRLLFLMFVVAAHALGCLGQRIFSRSGRLSYAAFKVACDIPAGQLGCSAFVKATVYSVPRCHHVVSSAKMACTAWSTCGSCAPVSKASRACRRERKSGACESGVESASW